MYKKRIELLDFLRGIAILIMLYYHFVYDLALFEMVDWSFVFNVPMGILGGIGASTFILLAGFSSKLSRNNLRRGAIVFALGAGVSIGARFAGITIHFGVLQLLGSSMMFYGLVGRYLEKLPRFVIPIVCIPSFLGTYYMYHHFYVSVRWLYPLGLRNREFVSADYFPIMPWLFLFLIGTWLAGEALRDVRKPWMDMSFPSAINWLGRRSLLIYLIHQPVMYSLTFILSTIIS